MNGKRSRIQKRLYAELESSQQAVRRSAVCRIAVRRMAARRMAERRMAERRTAERRVAVGRMDVHRIAERRTRLALSDPYLANHSWQSLGVRGSRRPDIQSKCWKVSRPPGAAQTPPAIKSTISGWSKNHTLKTQACLPKVRRGNARAPTLYFSCG